MEQNISRLWLIVLIGDQFVAEVSDRRPYFKRSHSEMFPPFSATSCWFMWPGLAILKGTTSPRSKTLKMEKIDFNPDPENAFLKTKSLRSTKKAEKMESSDLNRDREESSRSTRAKNQERNTEEAFSDRKSYLLCCNRNSNLPLGCLIWCRYPSILKIPRFIKSHS